jgi:probable O-glycosylation ligase (exosortase A-associated)
MTVPLLLPQSDGAKIWVRNAISRGGLSVLAALGTQSRGALLGLGVMGTFIWLKSRRKAQVAILIAFALLVLVPFMPQSWVDRMSSIQNYEEDASAVGRLQAWRMAYNLASDRLLGGGFEAFHPQTFKIYLPGGTYHDAHSIYFEVLGEHGFIGLAIFLMLAAFTWFSAAKVLRACKPVPELKWLRELMAMTQVSLVAYLATGVFLGMAYFDYFYNLVLIVVMAKVILAQHVVAPVKDRWQSAIVPASG